MISHRVGYSSIPPTVRLVMPYGGLIPYHLGGVFPLTNLITVEDPGMKLATVKMSRCDLHLHNIEKLGRAPQLLRELRVGKPGWYC